VFDRHEIVYANGAPAESLYLGKDASRALPPEALEEVMLLFPGLVSTSVHQMARATPETGRQSRRLAERHARNDQPLLAMR
jgi:hypothetical protein